MKENFKNQLNSIEELLKILVVNSLTEGVQNISSTSQKSALSAEEENFRTIVEFLNYAEALKSNNIIRSSDYMEEISYYIVSVLFDVEISNHKIKTYSGTYRKNKGKVIIKFHDDLKKVTLPLSDEDRYKMKTDRIQDLLLVLGKNSGMKMKEYSEIPYVFYSIPVKELIESKGNLGKRVLKKYNPVFLLNEKMYTIKI